MSVKRLTYLDDLLGYVSTRLREIKKEWSHAEDRANKDILDHLEVAHQTARELLKRARNFQKRDLEKTKKERG